ncbi:MAG: Kelch repeat-containing protein [Planctomycetota bacterium]
MYGTGGNMTAREGTVGCYDPLNHRFVIFGGHNGGNYLSILEVLNLKPVPRSWANLGLQSPPGPLAYASGVYDPEGECMVVFGGEQSGGALTNSVWLLHLATPGSESWTQVSIPTTPRPSPRKGCTAFWDAPNHRAIFIW